MITVVLLVVLTATHVTLFVLGWWLCPPKRWCADCGRGKVCPVGHGPTGTPNHPART